MSIRDPLSLTSPDDRVDRIPVHTSTTERHTESDSRMRFYDYFDRTFVINLASRPDRRRAAVDELTRVGLPIRAGRVELFEAFRPDEPGSFESVGARGCFESHLSVLRAARDARARNVLICEDDLLLSQRFRSFEPAIVDQLRRRPDWGIVYFGHQEPVSRTGAPRLIELPSNRHLLLLHFYAVNGPVLDRLITFLETLLQRPAGHPRGGPMHVDGAISSFREHNPDVRAFLAEPVLAFQRGSRSDIAGGKWWDQIPQLSAAANLARGLATRIAHRNR